MKKLGVFLIFIAFSLIFVSFVLAQNENNGDDGDDINIPEEIKKGVEDVKGIRGKAEEALEQDIIVPENLQVPARVIFGIKGEIPLQHFIVLIGVWVMLFLIISSIFKIMPLFEGWKAWVGGAVVTCLIAVTGTIRSIAIFFFNLGNVFGFLEELSVLKIVLAVGISALLFYGASILIKIINKKLMLDKAEMTGAKAGAGAKMLEETFEQGAGI